VIQRRGISVLHAALRSRRARVVNGDLSPPGLDDREHIDRLKALLGAVMTFVLTLVVIAFSIAESLLQGHTQISSINLVIFLIWGLITMLWLIFRGAADRFGDLFQRATVQPQSGGDGAKLSEAPRLPPGRVRRFFRNLWIPVTFQFAHAGWLVYASGGLAYSQYYMVPAVMMLIGQSVYTTPPVDLLDTKPRNVLIYLGRVVRAYWYPVIMIILLFAVVVLLQEHHPLVAKPAPQYEHYFTMLIELILGIFVVHFTRRADQAMFRRATGAIRL